MQSARESNYDILKDAGLQLTWLKPTKTSKERKLKLKKIHSEIKKNRGKIW